MVKVCVLARSFLDFKVFKQRKIDFPYFGRCFASYYDVLEDAKSYKCFFLFWGHTVHTCRAYTKEYSAMTNLFVPCDKTFVHKNCMKSHML